MGKNLLTNKNEEALFPSDSVKRDLAYWKSKLDGGLSEVNLPNDFSRSHATSFHAETHHFAISGPTRQEITSLSRLENVTPFTMLMTTFQLQMYRYSGEVEVAVGTKLPKTDAGETGCFEDSSFETAAIRTQFQEKMSFREALREVNRVVTEAQNHLFVPYAEIAAELNLKTTGGKKSFFQVMMSMNQSQQEATQADIELIVSEDGSGYTCSLIYDSTLFTEDTAARMAGHFNNLLYGALKNPDMEIPYLPLLTEKEEHTLLVEWNKPEAVYPRESSIGQLFEEQVATHPDNVALVFGDIEVTYRELDRRASQIANYLKESGLKQEQLVAVCLDRSVDMIASFLGVLKAGGAYVPFDLSYPPERIAYMLEDSRASFILTKDAIAERLPNSKADIICLDKEAETISAQPDKNTPGSSAESLAYVMYTSGSTGKPKGVAIIHRGIARLVKNIDYASVGTQETFLNLAQVAFDLSVFEIYGALLNGGKLVLMDSNRPPFEDIAKTIEQNRVTSLCVTPDRLNMLLEDFSDSLKSLRQVFSAGEALPVWLAHKCLSTLQNSKLINLYGPTENSVTTTSYHVAEVVPGTSTVSIGRPISNDSVFILDQYFQPVPIGVVGELFLSGDGIAREYLYKPELTKEKFPLNPFEGRSGQRLYRSGDLARFRADGNIEFARRADDQVKIRGHRIELGEVETAIGLFPSVRQSVAGTTIGKDGTKELVSYVVMNKGEDFDLQKLRSYIQQKLPQHMVPTFFVELEKMPVTPVGKIDRKNLPAPAVSTLNQQIVPPGNEIEEELVKLWEKLLDIKPIGTTNHYFELGGNSLMAMKMFSEIEKTFNKRLPVSILLQEDTIADLARHLSSDEQKTDDVSLVPIQSAGTRPPLFCIHGGGGEVFIYRGLSYELGNSQPVYGLRYTHSAEVNRLSIEALADKYLKEIKAVQPAGPYALLGFCFGGAIAYEMAQKLKAEGQEVSLLAVLNFANPVHQPVKSPGGIAYGAVIKENLKKLSEMPVHQRISFFTQKIRNAARLVFSSPVAASPAEKGPVTRAALTKAIAAYKPRPYPGEIILIRASKRENPDDKLGWKTAANGSIHIHNVPAEHETLLRKPNTKAVAACIKQYL